MPTPTPPTPPPTPPAATAGPGPGASRREAQRRDPGSPATRPGNAEPTVGTGSVVAIGCVLGLLLLVLAGVAFLILLRFF